jgi:hypothetical protein
MVGRANMTGVRVLLDHLDFILLSVRNQTESLFPQRTFAVTFNLWLLLMA